MALDLIFVKTGKEIKSSIANRIHALHSRLKTRNVELDKLLDDKQKLRSYILRNTQTNYSHGMRLAKGGTLYGKGHISSEEVEEINQMCRRVMEIEQEIARLTLVVKHLGDEQTFKLQFDDLVSYGFDIAEE